MAELSILIRKRGSIKSKLTIFSKYISNIESTYPDKIITDENVRLELELRLERIQTLIDNFDDIQGQIESVCENIEEQYVENESFESSFNAVIAKAKIIISKNAISIQQPVSCSIIPDSSSVSVLEPHSTQNQNIKLPTIQLKKFHGSYDDWLEFRDTFDSLIHSNESINNIQKFHYLRASLDGSASQIIKSLEFSSKNYDIAWKLICERYNNSRILINNHVKYLFNIESIREESSFALRRILDNVTKHLRALQMLQEATDHWDTMIIYLVSTKLDPTTARKWEEVKSSLEKPILDDLKGFLRNRADLLDSLEQSKNRRFSKNKQGQGTTALFTTKPYCRFCKNDHYIQTCPDFLKLNTKERLEQVKRARLCINCLRSGHTINECRSSSCKDCNRRHNSLLHFNTEQEESENIPHSESQTQMVNLSSNHSYYNSQVILSTALITVFDIHNKVYEARVLLDSGSQSSFITEDFCSVLNLPRSNINIKVNGLNQTHSNIKCKTIVNIKSRISEFKTQSHCLIVPHITSELPNVRIDSRLLNIPNNLKLADPTFNIPNKIDLLLGADHFWQFMCVGQIQLTRSGLVMQNSKFGWIISGPLSPISHNNNIQCNLNINFELTNQLERFWQIEEFSNLKPLSKEQKMCESHFLENTQRDIDGRFVVSIPLKNSTDVLGESYTTAKRRFLTLERKFEHDENFKSRYFDFLNEYKTLGHMKLVNTDNSLNSYYLPHHGVIKESSLTTKLRVVFDASAATSSGFSFNNIQMIGPTIQQDLLSLLIRFRKHNYVIAADIEKMYRMIQINPAQRPLQRILWRDEPSKPIDTYELTTVTYGTSSAPYLAIRCLYQIGLDCDTESPLVSKVIKNDFYVDDMLSGADTIEEAIFLANEVSRELKKGCFNLRKWVSNSSDILCGINSQDTTNIIDFGCNENTKTLGLIWNGRLDTLLYNINPHFNHNITKRTILSETSQIFDPLGLLSPCIILAKIILQNLWCEKLSWDEKIPAYIYTKWLTFRDELLYLNNLKIPRQITGKDLNYVELHGFCDASSQAFGSCVYMKSHNQTGDISVQLVCAKSKVAPIKVMTIPRLELCAAVLLTKLVEKVKNSLDMPIQKFTYWTDSTIVLGWINTQPNLLQIFVANRIENIQEFTKISDWRHVSSSDNPADHLSRGIKPSLLCTLNNYWHGPNWLREPESSWPISHVRKNNLPELKKIIHSHKTTINILDFHFESYSDLTKLERIIAYCLRFKSNCQKTKNDRVVGHLTSQEIKAAFMCLIKISQEQSYFREIHLLSNGERLSSKSKLLKLNPFLDNNTLIRVGGRLSNSNFNFDKRFPIVLSSKNYFTKLLFVREHKKLLHAGPQLLLSILRDNFWPIQGRNLARKVVHDCVQCFKAKPNIIIPLMGNLPKTRLNPAPPFFTTGVDYAGPFLIKDKKGRGCKISKCYISIFICFLTRAIHLELVSDLTKESFIAALRRFTSRRGKPAQIYSDNGTNFVGANSELQKFGLFLQNNASDLMNSIENEGISWSFIPPRSPHFGGLWEAGVKSTKYHLLRVARNAAFTFEQFYTLLVQIEAILNSRPLTPLSCDPSDLTPLTPSHFLIGRIMTSVADPNIMHINENRLSHFQHVQKVQQHFWTRWSREYISEMQQRCKWKREHGSLQLNDLVIIKENNLPTMKWCLGRVIELHPGSDGIARVATIKTAEGTIKRSFSKICPLPKNTEERDVSISAT